MMMKKTWNNYSFLEIKKEGITMPIMGVHYEVKWHHKETNEIAYTKLNNYDEYNDYEEAVTKVRKHIERVYPIKSYNCRVEIKMVIVDNKIKEETKNVTILIGDQTEIDKDTKLYGF
jgi:hypothetical protein